MFGLVTYSIARLNNFSSLLSFFLERKCIWGPLIHRDDIWSVFPNQHHTIPRGHRSSHSRTRLLKLFLISNNNCASNLKKEGVYCGTFLSPPRQGWLRCSLGSGDKSWLSPLMPPLAAPSWQGLWVLTIAEISFLGSRFFSATAFLYYLYFYYAVPLEKKVIVLGSLPSD